MKVRGYPTYPHTAGFLTREDPCRVVVLHRDKKCNNINHKFMYVVLLSQFSHPAISNFPLILLLPYSACQPHPPRQFTPLTCAHCCLSSHLISPAYSHQLHTQSFASMFFAMQVFPAVSCLPSRYQPRLSLIPCFVWLLVIRPSLPSLTKNFASPLLIPFCRFLNRLSVCQSLSKTLNFLPLSSESFVLQLGPYTTRYMMHILLNSHTDVKIKTHHVNTNIVRVKMASIDYILIVGWQWADGWTLPYAKILCELLECSWNALKCLNYVQSKIHPVVFAKLIDWILLFLYH